MHFLLIAHKMTQKKNPYSLSSDFVEIVLSCRFLTILPSMRCDWLVSEVCQGACHVNRILLISNEVSKVILVF